MAAAMAASGQGPPDEPAGTKPDVVSLVSDLRATVASSALRHLREQPGYVYQFEQSVDLGDLARRHDSDLRKVLLGRVFDAEDAWSEAGWNSLREADDRAHSEAIDAALAQLTPDVERVAQRIGLHAEELEAALRSSDAVLEELSDQGPRHYYEYTYTGRAALECPINVNVCLEPSEDLFHFLRTLRIDPPDFLVECDAWLVANKDVRSALAHDLARRDVDLDIDDPVEFTAGYRELFEATRSAFVSRYGEFTPSGPPAVDPGALVEALGEVRDAMPIIKMVLDADFIREISRPVSRSVEDALVDAVEVDITGAGIVFTGDSERRLGLRAPLTVLLGELNLDQDGVPREHSHVGAVLSGYDGVRAALYEAWCRRQDASGRRMRNASAPDSAEAALRRAPLFLLRELAASAGGPDQDRQPSWRAHYSSAAHTELERRAASGWQQALDQELRAVIGSTKGRSANHDEMMWLLEQGANPDATDAHGEPLVHVAARANNLGALRLLAQLGADLAATNDSLGGRNAWTAVMSAYPRGRFSIAGDVLHFLLAHNAGPQLMWIRSCASRQIERSANSLAPVIDQIAPRAVSSASLASAALDWITARPEPELEGWRRYLTSEAYQCVHSLRCDALDTVLRSGLVSLKKDLSQVPLEDALLRKVPTEPGPVFERVSESLSLIRAMKARMAVTTALSSSSAPEVSAEDPSIHRAKNQRALTNTAAATSGNPGPRPRRAKQATGASS